MLKKHLLFAVLTSLVNLLTAQCSPDVSCLPPGAGSGICPNHELDTGTVGEYYSQTVSIKVPANGADFGQPLTTIQHVDITGVDSLAPGLGYTCNPPNCKFPGNSTGCIVVSGIPTTAWDHKMTVHAMAYVSIFFVNTSQPQNFTNFYSVIENVAGIGDAGNNRFDLSQNSPNPFQGETEIRFSSPDHSVVDITVFDPVGTRVYKTQVSAVRGLNTVRFKAENFSPGVYFYSVSGPHGTLTRKMIVSR
ncbi:MAG TPA: T9SS type A sorting domain-containing protein [Bacteroidia bacterium]|jgi:hypothetical protein